MVKMDRVGTRSSIVAFLADNTLRRRGTLVSLSLHRCNNVRCWSRSSSRHCAKCPKNTGAPKEQWDARQQPTQWEPNEKAEFLLETTEEDEVATSYCSWILLDRH